MCALMHTKTSMCTIRTWSMLVKLTFIVQIYSPWYVWLPLEMSLTERFPLLIKQRNVCSSFFFLFCLSFGLSVCLSVYLYVYLFTFLLVSLVVFIVGKVWIKRYSYKRIRIWSNRRILSIPVKKKVQIMEIKLKFFKTAEDSFNIIFLLNSLVKCLTYILYKCGHFLRTFSFQLVCHHTRI